MHHVLVCVWTFSMLVCVRHCIYVRYSGINVYSSAVSCANYPVCEALCTVITKFKDLLLLMWMYWNYFGHMRTHSKTKKGNESNILWPMCFTSMSQGMYAVFIAYPICVFPICVCLEWLLYVTLSLHSFLMLFSLCVLMCVSKYS